MTLDDGSRARPVTTHRKRDTLVLTLPADPKLRPLTRLVSTHFLRQNGASAAVARRGARAVERRCGPLLRAAGKKKGDGHPVEVVLLLRQLPSLLAVFGRAGKGPETCLLRVVRPDHG